jgi:hypothetical protein
MWAEPDGDFDRPDLVVLRLAGRDQAESGRAYFLPLRTRPRSHAWRDKDAQNRPIQPRALPARKLGDLCRELAAIDGYGRLSGWFHGIRARGRRSGE